MRKQGTESLCSDNGDESRLGGFTGFVSANAVANTRLFNRQQCSVKSNSMNAMHFAHWDFNIDKFITPYIPRPTWIRHLPQPIRHFLGYRPQPAKRVPDVHVFIWSWIGAFSGVALLEGLFLYSPYFVDRGVLTIVASFVCDLRSTLLITQGASAVLTFGACEAPFSQPRSVFWGHTLSAITGVMITKLFKTNEARFGKYQWLCGAIACATASTLTAITKTVHPPAGATALLAAVNGPITALGWYYIPVVMLSAALFVTMALIVNNIERHYPAYWWVAGPVGPDLKAQKTSEESKSPSSNGGRVSSAEQAPSVEYINEPVETTGSRMNPIYGPEVSVVVGASKIIVPTDIEISQDEKSMLKTLQQKLIEAQKSPAHSPV